MPSRGMSLTGADAGATIEPNPSPGSSATQADSASSTSTRELLSVLRGRRSCRRYVRGAIPPEILDTVLEAGRWAPSGCSSEPWELILVHDPEMLAAHARIYRELRRLSELADAGPDGFPFPDMDYLDQVGALIVVCGDRRLAQTYPQLYYRWDIYQQSIAACIQNMFLATTAQGLGATWLSMGRKLEPPLRELFAVPDGYRVETVLAVGWPDGQLGDRDRRPLSEIVHRERFDSSRARTNDQVQDTVRAIRNRRRADRSLSGEISASSPRLQEEARSVAGSPSSE